MARTRGTGTRTARTVAAQAEKAAVELSWTPRNLLRRRAMVACVAVLAAIGSAITATPAWADPFWQPSPMVGACNTWEPEPFVKISGCIVVNAGSNYTQPYAEVYDGMLTEVTISAPRVQLFENGKLISDRWCYTSRLNPYIAVACMSPTTWRDCDSHVQARVFVTVSGRFGEPFYDEGWVWSPTEKMCTAPDQ
jgi:hypothetical protein